MTTHELISVTETNHHISDDYNVQNLINHLDSFPDQYKHLQVFLHWKPEHDFKSNNEFLMVTPSSFGKVELLDVGVEANYVILEIKDCCTQQSGNVRIDINDSNPKTLFICWQDVKKMVLDDIATKYSNDDELLEFDF